LLKTASSGVSTGDELHFLVLTRAPFAFAPSPSTLSASHASDPDVPPVDLAEEEVTVVSYDDVDMNDVVEVERVEVGMAVVVMHHEGSAPPGFGAVVVVEGALTVDEPVLEAQVCECGV
jgi:hypothetical protein